MTHMIQSDYPHIHNIHIYSNRHGMSSIVFLPRSHAEQIAMWRANHSGELRRGQMAPWHPLAPKELGPGIAALATLDNI